MKIISMKNELSTLIFVAAFIISFAGIAQESNNEKDKNQSDNNQLVSYQYFPASLKDKSKASLIIKRTMPKYTKPDEEFSYKLRVMNNTLYSIDDVEVMENLPANFQFAEASPKAEMRRQTLKWDLDMLAPQQTETITITGKARSAGKIKPNGKAKLSYDLGTMNTLMDVIEAQLALNAEYPKKVIINEDIPLKLDIENQGSAPVKEATLSHKLPEGIVTSNQNEKLNLNIGKISPQSSKTYNLKLKALKTGKYKEDLVVKAGDNLTAKTDFNLLVGKPVLKVSANSPDKRYVGNPVSYTLQIKNEGNAPAKNSKAVLNLPADTLFKSANEGGEKEDNQVVWDLGKIKPNESLNLKAILEGKKIKTVENTAEITSDANKTIRKKFKTNIEGIPALLISLNDYNDPVPVGKTETYEIKVKNQGSLAAKNVVVSCNVPNNMKPTKLEGPTLKKSYEDNVLTMQPLEKLKPGDTAVWKLRVEALKAGNVKFKVNIKSNKVKGVHEEESTHLYK